MQPDLFDWNDDGGCRMNRQPKTKEELDGMVRLLWAQDIGCIRYGGADIHILKRFAELGIAEQCDVTPPRTVQRVFRNQVSFNFNFSSGAELGASGLAKTFQAHLQAEQQRILAGMDSESLSKYGYRFKQGKQAHTEASFSYSWYGGIYHPVDIVRLGGPEGEWVIRHSPVEVVGSQGVSFQLHDWLIKDGRFSLIRWYSADEWAESRTWSELPW